MKVELISYTQDNTGKNLLEQIAFVARVSNPSNQHNDATAEREKMEKEMISSFSLPLIDMIG